MTKNTQRKRHSWKIMVASERGGHSEEQVVRGFWDPEHETTSDSVAAAAVAQAWLKSEKRVKYVAASEAKLVA
jgi:hypothetical protein